MVSKTAAPKLGRGLAALLGESSLSANAEGGSAIAAIPIDLVDPNPFQPRSDFDPSELESLTESIRVQGLLQPIIVRHNPSVPERYQIIAGERRFRAATQAGLNEIPSIVRDVDDSDAAVIALVENLQRQNLNAIEEAEGYQRLLDEFGLTQEALGMAVSKSRAHIGNTIRLLRLPAPVIKDVRSGTLSSGHARALINSPNPEALAEQVAKRALSVRQTEALVSKVLAGQDEPHHAAAKKPDIADLEQRVSQTIGCRVSITTTRRGRGEISIRFNDLFQLEELIGRLTAQGQPVAASRAVAEVSGADDEA